MKDLGWIDISKLLEEKGCIDSMDDQGAEGSILTRC